MDLAKRLCLDKLDNNLTKIDEFADCLAKTYQKLTKKNATFLDLFEDSNENPLNGCVLNFKRPKRLSYTF